MTVFPPSISPDVGDTLIIVGVTTVPNAGVVISKIGIATRTEDTYFILLNIYIPLCNSFFPSNCVFEVYRYVGK